MMSLTKYCNSFTRGADYATLRGGGANTLSVTCPWGGGGLGGYAGGQIRCDTGRYECNTKVAESQNLPTIIVPNTLLIRHYSIPTSRLLVVLSCNYI